MRSYAQTYPQLINQALSAGWEGESLLALRHTHEFAADAVNGMYRASGARFLDHLTRTASIVLAQGSALPIVLAAHLHANEILHMFPGSRTRPPTWIRRKRVRELIGEEAETLTHAYPQVPWTSPAAIEAHRAGLGAASTMQRNLILLRLANELEDYLDDATLFSRERELEAALVHGEATAGLARALGHGQLADELVEALPTRASLQEDLVLEHGSSFFRSTNVRRKRTWPEGVAYRVFRRLRNEIRRRS